MCTEYQISMLIFSTITNNWINKLLNKINNTSKYLIVCLCKFIMIRIQTFGNIVHFSHKQVFIYYISLIRCVKFKLWSLTWSLEIFRWKSYEVLEDSSVVARGKISVRVGSNKNIALVLRLMTYDLQQCPL